MGSGMVPTAGAKRVVQGLRGVPGHGDPVVTRKKNHSIGNRTYS